MYIEFIIIYAALAVIIGLLTFILIRLMKSGVNQSKNNNKLTQSTKNYVNQDTGNQKATISYASPSQPNSNSGGVVFCYKCGSQYSINENRCPHCGTQRG